MIFLLLRVTGQNWRPSELAERFSVPDCSIWHKGDAFQSGRGRVHSDTGFALSLPEEESWSAALLVVKSMLSTNAELFNAVASMGLHAELSIGVTVGEAASFAPSLEFPLELISELHSTKVAVIITAYPTSDE